LARGIYKNKALSEIKTLFSAKTNSDEREHFGSRLLFKDNTIFMTIGDRGKRDLAQNLDYHNGKILRLTLEGKPATGNPFEKTKNALPEIWSYGHRNPQGIDIDPITGEIYSIEFGPRGGDELNLIQKSKNYGWPVITYGKEYWGPSIGDTHNEGMQQPVIHWTPSISPSGMTFYHSEKYPEWKNSLFLAALGSRHLRRLELKDNQVTSEEMLFSDLNERIRHVRISPDGYLYFSTDSGKLMKVENIIN
jgi:glucose/arabinose dehydrogenase